MKFKSSISFLTFLACSFIQVNLIGEIQAQPRNITLNNSLNSIYVNQMYDLDSNLHTAIKPMLFNEFQPKFEGNMGSGMIAINRLHDERIVDLVRPKFGLKIYPLFNLMPGLEIESKSGEGTSHHYRQYFSNGFNMNMNFGNRVHIGMNYLYSHSNYNGYFSNSSIGKGALQGYGTINQSGNSFFNNYIDGYISYSPNDIFNLQTGMGRNFIGEGYRSMLLSDYAYNYPYFKITTNIWKIKYVNLYAMQFDLDGRPADLGNINQKYTSSHYLSVNIGRRWNVGLYESVVWQGQDSTYNRGFDINYLNPIIFLRPVEYSIGSPDNVLVGLNLSYKVRKWGLAYSQLMLDEFLLSEIRAGNGWWANKFGVQVGFKTLFEKFNVQLEYNTARPYTYTHSAPSQNYTHLNLPLAHPLGANFKEVIAILRYRHYRLIYEGTFILGQAGLGNDTTNVGQNIFKSSNTRQMEYNNAILQGDLQEVIYARVEINYLMNYLTGLSFNVGVQYRLQSNLSVETGNSTVVFAGIKTNLFNRYNEY